MPLSGASIAQRDGKVVAAGNQCNGPALSPQP
jgi:hypothetical protein